MSDRKLLSSEKHEIEYVRRLARSELKSIKENQTSILGLAGIEKICKAVLKFAKVKRSIRRSK
jgi:cell division protein FtsI/penicillin-binding protein 2